jgi:hypothetical protein
MLIKILYKKKEERKGKRTEKREAGRVAQIVEHLPREHEAPPKKRKRKRMRVELRGIVNGLHA